jgi:hypothetical protein
MIPLKKRGGEELAIVSRRGLEPQIKAITEFLDGLISLGSEKTSADDRKKLAEQALLKLSVATVNTGNPNYYADLRLTKSSIAEEILSSIQTSNNHVESLISLLQIPPKTFMSSSYLASQNHLNTSIANATTPAQDGFLEINSQTISEEDLRLAKTSPNSPSAESIAKNANVEIKDEHVEFSRNNPDTNFAKGLMSNSNYTPTAQDVETAISNPNSKFTQGLTSNPKFDPNAEKILTKIRLSRSTTNIPELENTSLAYGAASHPNFKFAGPGIINGRSRNKTYDTMYVLGVLNNPKYRPNNSDLSFAQSHPDTKFAQARVIRERLNEHQRKHQDDATVKLILPEPKSEEECIEALDLTSLSENPMETVHKLVKLTWNQDLTGLDEILKQTNDQNLIIKEMIKSNHPLKDPLIKTLDSRTLRHLIKKDLDPEDTKLLLDEFSRVSGKRLNFTTEDLTALRVMQPDDEGCFEDTDLLVAKKIGESFQQNNQQFDQELAHFFTDNRIGYQLKKIIAEALPTQSSKNECLRNLAQKLEDAFFHRPQADNIRLDSDIRKILNSKSDGFQFFR